MTNPKPTTVEGGREMSAYIDIVFDGPPAPESGRFVEVEDDTGASIWVGEWIETPPYWRLRIKNDKRINELEAL